MKLRRLSFREACTDHIIDIFFVHPNLFYGLFTLEFSNFFSGVTQDAM